MFNTKKSQKILVANLQGRTDLQKSLKKTECIYFVSVGKSNLSVTSYNYRHILNK